MELNTTNPYCFTYQTEESTTADRLLVELLGGIRIEGLGRMRVTMKVRVVNRKLCPAPCFAGSNKGWQ